MVTRGTCWLDVKGVDEPLQLAGGDLVLLTGGKGHTLRDNRRTRAVPFAEACRVAPGARTSCQPGGVFHYGGGGALTTIVGGRFEVEDADPLRLVMALPPVIHVKGDRGTPVQWLEANLQFVASEMASGLPGAQTVVSRLADILFVQAVRAHLAESGARSKGWLRGLLDPQIGHALALMHQRPEAPWTVQSLAADVGDVAFGICGTLHRPGRRIAARVSDALAHEPRVNAASVEHVRHRRSRDEGRLRRRVGLQQGVQALDGESAGGVPPRETGIGGGELTSNFELRIRSLAAASQQQAADLRPSRDMTIASQRAR